MAMLDEKDGAGWGLLQQLVDCRKGELAGSVTARGLLESSTRGLRGAAPRTKRGGDHAQGREVAQVPEGLMEDVAGAALAASHTPCSDRAA